MKIELSYDCDVSAYIGAMGIQGYHVRINATDYKIDEIDDEGLHVWLFNEDFDDDHYDQLLSDFIEWDRIDTLYIY